MAALLELANLYPSPHNGQPIRVKQTSETTLELHFDKVRGLQATDISYIFSFVSMGVFTKHLELCADALGHSLQFELDLPTESKLHGTGTVLYATCKIGWDDHKPNNSIEKALLFRQTSRKKYSSGTNLQLDNTLIEIALEKNMQLVKLDKPSSHQAIWLNQRAVFDDMFDEPVRRELDHWLRYTKQDKQQKMDGLAYDCMELNGSVMKYIVDHPRILRKPGISKLLKAYYLRTMKDDSDVFYMLAPFDTEMAVYKVGVVIMELWHEIAEAGLYLHPFGTIMSNHSAHQDFLKLVGVTSESREKNYLALIFRCGASEKPVPSLRIPTKQHLILE